MAKEKGFFKENGLDITIKNYHKGMNTTDEILKENSQFASIISTSITSMILQKELKMSDEEVERNAYKTINDFRNFFKTSIGLFMSREIITRHLHGSIKVQNSSFTYQEEKYVGAEFMISLPLSS